MEEANKLPLKRVELSLTKFNEVAIPHHLDLLRQHKANIIKHEERGEYARVRSEQVHARRVAAQLRALLAELEALRRQVRPDHWPRFDQLTQRSRDLTLRAIMDYLGIIERSCRAIVASSKAQLTESSPMSINRQPAEGGAVAGSAVSTDSVGVVAHAHAVGGEAEDARETDDAPLVQLHVDEREAALRAREATLREREAALRGWCELQREVRALHDVWRHVHDAACAQREQVEAVQSNVEVAADNVQVARSSLASAERLRAGAYGAGGAALGALAGGPLGLVLGAKAGAAAALAGSLLGYVGARVLGRRRVRQLDADPDPHTDPDTGRRKDQ